MCPCSIFLHQGDISKVIPDPSSSTRVTSVKLCIPAPREQYIPGASLEQEAGCRHGAPTELCTLCVLYTPCYTLKHSTLNRIDSTLYSLQFTVPTIHYILYIIHYTLVSLLTLNLLGFLPFDPVFC